MIPDEIKNSLIKETHTHLGHVGAYKTYQALRNNYQINNLYQEIKKFTKACDL
jgi:hypothetical protein